MAYSVPDTSTLDVPILLTPLSAVSTTDNGETGKIVTSNTGRRFKKVVVDDSCVAATAGYPAYWMVGTTANEVTSDYSDAQNSEQTGAAFAGLFCGTIAAATAQYAWIEIPSGGLAVDASVSTNVGVCDGLVAKADGFFDLATSFSDNVVAIAMEAASSNVADIVMLNR